MEMMSKESFNISWDEELAESKSTGTSLIYPGISPLVGDVFIYKIDTARYGLFQVTSTTPTSIRTQKATTITFVLNKIIGVSDVEALNLSSTRVFVFNKSGYVNGTQILLYEDTLITAESLARYRRSLISYYLDTYYNTTYFTLFGPNNLYDPYLVAYLNKTWDTSESPRSIDQLICSPINEKYSIWAYLTNRDLPFNLIARYVTTSNRELGSSDVFTTTNLNAPHILLGREQTDETYLFSNAFYTGTVDDMSELEKFVYEVITTRRTSNTDYLNAVMADFQVRYTRDELFTVLPILVGCMSIVRNALLCGR
jgi:hypothetical protein